LWKGLRNCRKIISSEKVRTIVTNFCEKPRATEYPKKITDLSQVTDKLSHNVVSSTPHPSGFDLATVVLIGTDCTGSLNPTTIRSRLRRPYLCMMTLNINIFSNLCLKNRIHSCICLFKSYSNRMTHVNLS
jgi:hypothetical protein